MTAAISCDEKTALDLLRKTNWDVDRACEMHFSDPKNQEKAKPKANKKQEEIYEKYKGILPDSPSSYFVEKGEEKVDNDGILEFLKDVSVNPLDPVTLVFSYLCKAKTMVYSESELE